MTTETRPTFTPGPWKVIGVGVEVGDNWFSDDMRPETINRADLNLIAAAPEMYEAARAFLSRVDDTKAGFDDCALTNCGKCYACRRFTLIRALAKAEGR